jgi:hypothetical membrane protein
VKRELSLQDVNTVAVVFIAVLIVVAHLVAPASYSWRDNTISQLAAQGYARAWIMRLGFVGFGILIVLGALDRARTNRRSWFHQARELALVLYGLGLLLAGSFSAEPFLPGVAFSESQAQLHSIAATLAGLGISLGMLLYLVRPGPLRNKIPDLVALTLTLAFSALFGMATSGAGIWQRCLWAVGFVWLVYIERCRDPDWDYTFFPAQQARFDRWFVQRLAATRPELIGLVEHREAGDGERWLVLNITPAARNRGYLQVSTENCEFTLFYAGGHRHFSPWSAGGREAAFQVCFAYLDRAVAESRE